MIVAKENMLTSDSCEVVASVEGLKGKKAIETLDAYLLSGYNVTALQSILTYTLDDAVSIQGVALHNIICSKQITVALLDADNNTVFTETKTPDEFTGFQFQAVVFLNGDARESRGRVCGYDNFNDTPIKKIVVTIENDLATDEIYLGYVSAFDIIDFGIVEKQQPQDSTDDAMTVTEANVSSFKKSGVYKQSFSITTAKRSIDDCRKLFRQMILSGFGTARTMMLFPFEGGYSNIEVFLGVFDSSNVKYDTAQTGNVEEFLWNATVGVLEVFGNVDYSTK